MTPTKLHSLSNLIWHSAWDSTPYLPYACLPYWLSYCFHVRVTFLLHSRWPERKIMTTKHFQFLREIHSVHTTDVKNPHCCSICRCGYKYEYSLKRHILKSHVNRAYISPSDLEVFSKLLESLPTVVIASRLATLVFSSDHWFIKRGGSNQKHQPG